MAFVQNFLLPLIQAIITIGMFGLLLLGIYFFVKKYFKRQVFAIRMKWKYGILKKPYNEQMVEWSMDINERKVPKELYMKEFYKTNKFNLGDFEEGLYVYDKVKKNYDRW